MKKLILLMLALVMVVSVFAACGDATTGSTPNKTTPTKPGGGTGTGDDETPEEEQINLDLDGIDYDGETVWVYHWKPDTGLEEFGMNAEDVANDAVKDAIYKRNTRTEEDLGIVIDWQAPSGLSGYTRMQNFIDKLEAKKSNSGEYVDIIAAQAIVMPYVMIKNHLTELNTYSDSLDLNKAWWPENIQEVFDIKGNMYFLSGDISANVLRMMTVLFVNKTTLESLGHDYDEFMGKILNYEWTLDDLISMTEGVYEDLDTATAGPSKGDKFGLVTTYYHSDGLYAGLGYKYMILSTADDQVFRLSSHIATETALNYVTKMQNWNLTNDLYMDPAEKTYQDAFMEGDALFILDRAWFGFELQNTDVKYAVLPTPALDTAQREYFTTIGNQFTAYGICDISEDYDRAAETLQTLGYYALSTTTPALYEVSFIGKFSKDDYNIKMFDIIRGAITFDIGRIYDYYISGTGDGYTNYFLPNIVSFPIRDITSKDVTFSFNSTGDPVRKLITEYIKERNKALLEFIDSKN